MKDLPLVKIYCDEWEQYELLDSGNRVKLERFGDWIVERPAPGAWWQPQLTQAEWGRASAVYLNEREGWRNKSSSRADYFVQFEDIKMRLKQTPTSKHVGVFPEQSGEWKWIKDEISGASHPMNVLNLFGYTGIATLIAARAGAKVTHVDGSKTAITWARENQELSGLTKAPIRWIVDDCSKYVAREIKRGKKYEGIILDPPAFGRGPKGQVWKVEKELPHLLGLCAQLLSDDARFIILTSYSVEISSLTLKNLLAEVLTNRGGRIENGEFALRPRNGGNILPMSIFAKWSRR